jgi:hypothetical protein
MIFIIKGDTDKIKKFLDEFVRETKAEYEKQGASNALRTIGVWLPPFDMGYIDEGESIKLWDTINFPKPMGFLFGRVKKKMEKNLRGYLEAKGLKVEVKISDK